ncbi:leucine-rich repeat protein [bacterium]|nr:MAG: leucine-rich repeat protein [bacterium]
MNQLIAKLIHQPTTKLKTNLSTATQSIKTDSITNTTKRLNYLTLSLLISLTSILPILLPATANAAPSTPPDSCFDYTTNLGEVTITDYYDHEANNNSNPACTREVIIPSIIGGNSVTSIGDYAFYDNQLTGLAIPSSVTSIGYEAFFDNQLTGVTIEGDITTAGGNEFRSNPIQAFTYGLDTYTSSSPITDDCFAFDGVDTITSFNKADITTIRDHSNACLNPNINIPSTIGGNSITSIGANAFSYNQLTSVTIPNSVTVLDGEAFRDNQLTSLTILNSITSIGEYAFFNNQIAGVTIPDSVTSLSPYAFVFQTKPGGTGYNDFWNSDQSSQNGQTFLDSVIYTNIYASPSQVTALNLTDSTITESYDGYDYNADGDQTDIMSGHLINPAHITATYKDTGGNTIAPSTTATGTGLSSYLVVDNPTNNLSLYYKAGNSYTVPPAPTIADYTIQTTPSNIASLTAGNNSIDYIYTANYGNNNNPSNNTVTLPNAVDGKNMTITTPATTNITCSNTTKESVAHPDNDYQYTMGFVDFCFTTNQTNNQVTLDFITDLKPSQVTARKYNPNTNSYNNLPTNANPAITETTIDGKHALTLTYTLIDNGELDLDPAAGTISDPVGLAVSNSTYDQLASTGENTQPILLAAVLLLVSGIVGVWYFRRGRKKR